jgi:hypothetical protein
MIIAESDEAFWVSWLAWAYQMARGTSTNNLWTQCDQTLPRLFRRKVLRCCRSHGGA